MDDKNLGLWICYWARALSWTHAELFYICNRSKTFCKTIWDEEANRKVVHTISDCSGLPGENLLGFWCQASYQNTGMNLKLQATEMNSWKLQLDFNNSPI